MEAVACHSVSHSISLCPHIFTCKCSFAMSHWPGLRSLAFVTLSILDPYWNSSSGLSCCCPVSWRSCGFGFSGLSNTPPVHRWGKVLVWTDSKPWIWAWVVSELVSLPVLLYLYLQGELSDTTLASKGAGSALLLSCPLGQLTQDTGSNSPEC